MGNEGSNKLLNNEIFIELMINFWDNLRRKLQNFEDLVLKSKRINPTGYTDKAKEVSEVKYL